MPEGKNYRILEKIASGGSAILYRAMQLSLDRVVAVKRLHQHLTQDENFTRRFVLEAKAAASLDHQNIVRVIDFGIEEGSYQMVMEFVEGESLKDVLDRWRPMQTDLALAIVHQVCRGLEHAHAKGIVHRDIKPGNVMLTKTGLAKITDFGLAKLAQSNSVQTASDTILGTPLYMSPEQAFGESVDQRSDLFSLGTVMYELLTGRQPFASENYMGVIQNIIHKEIPAVTTLNANISPEIEHIVMRALAKDRDQRFKSAREFREAIEQTMGLDALMRATAGLPVLLDRDAATRIMSKAEVAAKKVVASKGKSPSTSSSWSTVSSAKKRQGSGAPVWIIAPLVVLALGGAATWFFWPRIQAARTEAPANDVQQASMGDMSPFDLGSVANDTTTADSSVTTAAADTTAPAPLASVDTTPAKTPTTTPPETTAVAASEPKEEPKEEPKPEETAEVKPAKPRGEPDKPFREGYVLLHVVPSAQVFINGVFRGDAAPTLRLTMPVGLFSIECRAANHEPYLESIRVIPGELSQRTITLKKNMGTISLATTEGAELFVDGQFMGITPIMRPIEIAAGVHTLTLKKDRYFTWSSDVMVEPNSTLPLHITLSPRY